MGKLKNGTDLWISLSNDLIPKEFKKPIQDSNAVIWIHKYFGWQWDAYTPMFKYDIFSSELKPTQLHEGNFTCTILKDHCLPRGCGNFFSIKFGIIDKNNELRTGNGLGQQVDGIIETIKLMREIAKYEDWTHYDIKAI